jgi:outer membrane lipoprotein carrier protein
MRLAIAIIFIAAYAVSARAGGLESLEAFVKTRQVGRAEFTQVVTAPPRDGQAARSKTSSGSFEFLRPNRFRFVYRKPFEQTIVADGQTLWLHDVDLNQVTARKQAQVLGSTPAALIAAAPRPGSACGGTFNLQDAPDRDGLQWVEATPRQRDTSLRKTCGGLQAAPIWRCWTFWTALASARCLPSPNLQTNATLSPELFQFKPPAGADVIRQ